MVAAPLPWPEQAYGYRWQTGATGDATAAAAAETWQDAPLVCTGTEAGAAQDQAHKLLLRSVVPTARPLSRRST